MEKGDKAFVFGQDIDKNQKQSRSFPRGYLLPEKVLNSIPTMIWISDREGLNIGFNKGWLEFTGLREEELENSWWSSVHPDDLERCLKIFGEAFTAKKVFFMEYRLRSGNSGIGSRYLWMKDKAEPLFDDKGEFLGFIGLCFDINDLIESQGALKEKLLFIEALLDVFPLPSYYKDLQGIYLGCNRAYENLMGLSRKEIIGKTSCEFMPKDCAEADTLNDREIFNKEFSERLEATMTFCGTNKSVIFYKSVYADKAGNIAGLIGTIMDMTESKENEGKMKLLSAALDGAANAVAITDITGNIVWVNRSFMQLTGYSLEDVKGKNPRVLRSGIHDENFYKELWSTILSGQIWRNEIVNRRKDGMLYNEDMTITPVFTGDKITNFIAIKQDITSRKKYEQDLKKKNEELERFSKVAIDRELRMIELKKQISKLSGIKEAD